jgi:tRNA threonylcarbamoyladenosine biosynthesis protein TsaB
MLAEPLRDSGLLLALDSATRFAGIALYSGSRGLVAEYNWYAGIQHTVTLLPRVSEILAQHHIPVAELAAVAVALGPGSFTGLRVALATAKGLALAQELPLLGIPTLDVTAYPHLGQPLPVVAVVQAGRGRVCWARYRPGGSHNRPESAYRVSDVDALAAATDGPALFAGEITAPDRAALAARLGDRVRFAPPALALRRAGCLAEIAWARFTAGERDDLEMLAPLYLQEPASLAGPARIR